MMIDSSCQVLSNFVHMHLYLWVLYLLSINTGKIVEVRHMKEVLTQLRSVSVNTVVFH